jgi:hypothetical protein
MLAMVEYGSHSPNIPILCHHYFYTTECLSYRLDSISGMGVCSSSELTIGELGKARDLTRAVNRVESIVHQQTRV